MPLCNIVGEIVEDGVERSLRWVDWGEGAAREGTGLSAADGHAALDEAGKTFLRSVRLLAKTFKRVRECAGAGCGYRDVLCGFVVVDNVRGIRTRCTPDTGDTFGPFKRTDEPNGAGIFNGQRRGET